MLIQHYMLPMVGGCIEKTEDDVLSLVMETVETEQRTLHVVCGDGNSGNRAEDIACCLW